MGPSPGSPGTQRQSHPNAGNLPCNGPGTLDRKSFFGINPVLQGHVRPVHPDLRGLGKMKFLFQLIPWNSLGTAKMTDPHPDTVQTHPCFFFQPDDLLFYVLQSLTACCSRLPK